MHDHQVGLTAQVCLLHESRDRADVGGGALVALPTGAAGHGVGQVASDVVLVRRVGDAESGRRSAGSP